VQFKNREGIVDTSNVGVLRVQLLDRRERLQRTIAGSFDTSRLIQLLHEVESALKRIDAGSYGICELCNEPIEQDFLQHDPLVRVCLGHLSDEQRRAMERDLDLANRIQSNLLPSQHMRVNGWEVSYHYEPAGPVSGDYCDIVTPEVNGGDTYFFFGDVSGKGVAASLLMSHLHAIFRSLLAAPLPLKQLIERANRVFSDSTMSTQFATLLCGKLTRHGEMEICNAGHCPPLLVQGGRVARVDSTGLPAGLSYTGEYEVQKFRLSKGDTIFLYTDGLTESRNGSEEQYGPEKLAALLQQHQALPSQALIDACLKDVSTFSKGAPKVDDLTIMAVRRVE
jgi:sigma-B regulation protein RsbU (phosphoserine phosphatase)